ncbi:MAG: hypothetical protein ABL949_03820 [Fimbriimonadaceae bacterium]
MYLKRPDSVSRRFLALVVLLLLSVLIMVFSLAVKMPRWIEAEIILTAWWTIWIGILATLLYKGRQVEDDSEVTYGGKFSSSVAEASGCGLDAAVVGCGEGFAGGCAAILIALLAVLVAGLLVEFVLPALGFLLFISVGGMFARAVNDTHGCDGRLGKSLLWGCLWATLYIGPLLAIVPWLPVVFPELK